MVAWNLIVERSRIEKQGRVTRALAAGIDVPTKTYVGLPPDVTIPFIATGQLWVVEDIVPQAVERGQAFWLVDNGYYLTSGVYGLGPTKGHYEMTYKGLTPIFMEDPDVRRFPAHAVLAPWRKSREGYVLLALPGASFGKMLGLDMKAWCSKVQQRIQLHSDRPIIIREKGCGRTLQADLAGAAIVVTHSSNIALDAIIAGVPCVVAPTNPAAPMCRTNIADIESPLMEDRTRWWASLMCQQYTLAEMADGTAWRFMQQVMEQADAA